MTATDHAVRAPRWLVVIDPHGAANLVSDRTPGPVVGEPASLAGFRYRDGPAAMLDWPAAVEAMRTHNGGVSPHAAPPSVVVTSAAVALAGRLAEDASSALSPARDASSALSTRERNRVLAATGERWCSGCKAVLPIGAFWRHARAGYQAKCRTCKNRDATSSTSARGGRPARRVQDTTGLTRIPADVMHRMADAQSPAPAAAILNGPDPAPASPAPPPSPAPPATATLAPMLQTRLACGCTVTYNCQEAETLRARCTLAQRAVKAERQRGEVSPATTRASADALTAYHAHRGPFVPGGAVR